MRRWSEFTSDSRGVKRQRLHIGAHDMSGNWLCNLLYIIFTRSSRKSPGENLCRFPRHSSQGI